MCEWPHGMIGTSARKTAFGGEGMEEELIAS